MIDESDWSVNNHGSKSVGSYDVATSSGTKLVVARRSGGEIISYGNISPNFIEDTGN